MRDRFKKLSVTDRRMIPERVDRKEAIQFIIEWNVVAERAISGYGDYELHSSRKLQGGMRQKALGRTP